MRVALYWLLGAVALAAAVLSFDALRALALLCGFSPWLAWLLPVGIDAGATAGALGWIARPTGAPGRAFGRALALALLGLSVVGNAIAHAVAVEGDGAPAWWVVAAVSGVAPAVLAAMVHLGALLARPVDLPQVRELEVAAEAAAEAAGVPVVIRSAWPIGATTLYRLFDVEGELLYVGITSALGSRLSAHRRTQPWWDEVAETAVEAFDDRRSALAAEREAIETEGPRFNKAPGSLVDFCTAGPPTPVTLHVAPAPIEPGDRAAALLAAGVGRRVLARELGITEHEARKLIESREATG